MRARILLIERDPGLCRRLRGLLERRGLDVDAVGHVHEALERAGHLRRPDLVLVDVHPPAERSIPALLALRRAVGAPTVAMTSLQDEVPRGLPVDAVLRGPLSAGALRRILPRRASRPSPAAPLARSATAAAAVAGAR